MENYSKKEMVENIPKHIIDMYKISGFDDISYQKYLKSKSKFQKEFEYENKNAENYTSLVTKTKNEILSSSDEEKVDLIINALNNSDIEIQRVGASLIEKAPEGKIELLKEIVSQKIIEALNSSDIQTQRIAMNMISFSSKKNHELFKNMVVNIITEGLATDDMEVQRVVAKKISLAPEKDQAALREILYKNIINFFETGDVISQRLASTLIQYAPKDKQEELKRLTADKFELLKKEGKSNQLVESLLYLKYKNDNENSVFFREKFSKTGSSITLLLGEQFKNNLVIRHIEESCFLAWKKAYENHQAWSEAGFEYVPIEPIYSFNNDKSSNLTNVTSGVLDLNLEEWYSFSGNSFKESLSAEKNKILTVLAKLGINHGHPNDANFCLRFYRDDHGHIDLERLPRLYIIDFDKAVLVEEI